MPCPHCASTSTRERPTRTQLGYRTFSCLTCRRHFNERTGTPFNHLAFPTDIVLQVVLWRLRYKLSADITAGIRAGQCACDLRNPQGICCLGNVRRLIGATAPENPT